MMESLKFVEVYVSPGICGKLSKCYGVKELIAEMDSLKNNLPESTEELKEDVRRYEVLLSKIDRLFQMKKRLVISCEKRGAPNHLRVDFACPFCEQEKYKAYMKRMDMLEKAGEIKVERGEHIPQVLTDGLTGGLKC